MLRRIKGYVLYACEAQYHRSCRALYIRDPSSCHSSDPEALSQQPLMEEAYCVLNVAGVKNSVHVSGKNQDLNPPPVTSKCETVFLHVNSFVANVHSVTGLPQKKGVNPNYCYHHTEIKHVNDVSCVGHLSSANTLTNVLSVAINPPVGARLQQFWEKWEALGSGFTSIDFKDAYFHIPIHSQSRK